MVMGNCLKTPLTKDFNKSPHGGAISKRIIHDRKHSAENRPFSCSPDLVNNISHNSDTCEITNETVFNTPCRSLPRSPNNPPLGLLKNEISSRGSPGPNPSAFRDFKCNNKLDSMLKSEGRVGISASTPNTVVQSDQPLSCVSNCLICSKFNKPTFAHNYYVAIFSYSARSEEELTINKGERIAVLNDNDPDWWFVEHSQSNMKGYIPTAYIAKEGSVESEDWFIVRVTRKDSERLLLLDGNPRGTFLVRQSETSQGSLTLSVRDQEKSASGAPLNTVKHYRIKHFAVGNYHITAKCTFSSLFELVSFYTQGANGLCCHLVCPCPATPPVTTDLSVKTKDQWEIHKSSIVLMEQLGGGQFGEVWLGKWNGTTEVAVKTLKQGTMTREEFLKEARIMRAARHPKLVRLYAVCTEDPIYIVTELMVNGSLLNYLRDTPEKQLELRTLIDMMAQIASGMAYLEAAHFIHRDLAARNILVGDNHCVKVADFGLARMVEDRYSATYTAQKSTKFPIKWTAPEAAIIGRFTIKSDVWSFGIVVYEIVTRGHVPYPSMDNTDTLNQVSRGYRMPRPASCPSQVYDMMLRMWDGKPEKRPTFAYLFEFFEFYFVASETDYKQASSLQSDASPLPPSGPNNQRHQLNGTGSLCKVNGH